MSFLKNIFSKKDKPLKGNDDFWCWFQKNERAFFNVVKQEGNIEEGFFSKLSPKLEELREGYFYLTGMYDDNTVELVITVDGTVKNIVFVEELISSAPTITGWKFTALKPALNIENVNIEMEGYNFNKNNLNFYADHSSEYPDEIDITIVHNDFNEDNETTITNGSYIFLDNYLGELDFVGAIDNVTITGKEEGQSELIPIEKLKDFLIWRQKEFVEKYDGIRYNTEDDTYSLLEAELENGNAIIAVINTDLLNWESKASHPWILHIEIPYNGEKTNGMPDDQTRNLLEEIEDKILGELKDFEGYLHIGRQTADGLREIYFACKDYRKPSKVIDQILISYSNEIEMNYDIFKDKYWQFFNRFN